MSKWNKSLLPKLIDSHLIFEESLIKIQRDQLQINGHPPYLYYSLITQPFAVAILATTPEGAYVLNEEYRHPTGHILIGCPGGYIDEGENALQAAQRELLEETGYQAESFHIIGSAFPYAGFTPQKTIYVRALRATLQTNPQLEISEVIQSRLFMLDEIFHLIQTGIEVDGILCAALLFDQLHKAE